MKMLITITMALFTLLGFAQDKPLPPLRSPEGIIELARKGRFDFMDAIYEVRNSAMERRAYEENLNYMMILPELAIIEKELQYPEFGVSPTHDLADYLTGSIMKRLQFDKLTEEEVIVFVKWAQQETIYTALEYQSRFIMDYNGDAQGWNRLFIISSTFVDEISKLKGVSLMLEDTAEAFQGQILIQYLNLTYRHAKAEEFIQFVKRLKAAESVEKVLKYLNFEWGNLRDPFLKLKFFKIIIAASEQLRSIRDDRFFTSVATLGEHIAFDLIDLLSYNLKIDKYDLNAALTFLSQKDWAQVTDFLIKLTPDMIPPSHYESIMELTQQALNLPTTWIFKDVKAKLKSINLQLSVGKIDHSKLEEGLYKITKGNQTYYLWILYSVPWKIQSHLMTSHGDSVTTFGISEYNIESQKLSLIQVTNEGFANDFGTKIEIDLKLGKLIEGQIATLREHFPIKLEHISSLPSIQGNYPLIESNMIAMNSKNKDFSFEFIHTDFASWDLKMKVTKNNQLLSKQDFKTAGACFDDSEFCDFVSTSQDMTQWNFLRGAMVNENEFKGFIIQGLSFSILNLKVN